MTDPPKRFPPEMEVACKIIEQVVNEELKKRNRYSLEHGGNRNDDSGTINSVGKQMLRHRTAVKEQRRVLGFILISWHIWVWVCAINSDSRERKIQPCLFLELWGSFGCGKSYPPMRLILVKREHLIFACPIVKFGCTACKSECPCAPCIVVANLMISVSYVCLVPRKIPTRYSTTVCNRHFSHTLHVQ